MRIALASLFLSACAAPPAPPPPTIVAIASVSASPPPPPPPLRGVEHPTFTANGSAELELFAPLDPPPQHELPLGKTVRVHFAVCDFDQTGAVERVSCRAVTRASFEKIGFGDLQSPL